MIITIARQCGCFGDSIGEKLAEIYSIPVYNKETLRILAEKNGALKKYPDFFDEKQADMFLNAIAAENYNDFVKTIPLKALEMTIGKKSCVVIGRCADFAYKDEKNAVRIFLSGNKKLRIQHISEKHMISLRKADIIVEETDARRESYHKYYTGENWGYAENYDLCLDVSRLGEEKTIHMICKYIEESGILNT